MLKANSTRRAPRKVVESDFAEAIKRLVAGQPTHNRLRRLASDGRLKITFATVALEARRSRSLIAHKSCGYQDIRAQVLALMEEAPQARRDSSANKIERLNAKVAELTAKLSAAMDAQVEYFMAKQKAERTAAKWRDAYKRARAAQGKIVSLESRTRKNS